MTVHGAKLEADLNEIMPNVSSSSILIVDWEAWRPLYAENDDGLSYVPRHSFAHSAAAAKNWRLHARAGGCQQCFFFPYLQLKHNELLHMDQNAWHAYMLYVHAPIDVPFFSFCFPPRFYREYSRRLVLADPNWNHKDNATATDAEASRRFDEGAKAFFTYTVNLIKQLRPNVRLGFYSQGIDQPIPQGAADNAALLWLWEIVDILAPSIYPSSNFTRDKGSIESMVIGALESAAMVKPPANRPEVYPYARAFVGEGGKPFTAEELAEQLQLSAGLGVDGIIVWGSSSDYDGGGCSMVDAELRTYAGNVVKQCIANRAACSATHCDGHGNCVDYNPNYLEETCIDATHAAPVTCRCKNGYAGPNCTQSLPALVPVIAELY